MKEQVNKQALNASKECKEKALNSNKIVTKDEDKAPGVSDKK